MNCGALVLAGGRSSRLGFDKALIRMDGQPLVEWLPVFLSSFFSPVAVVADRRDRYTLHVPLLADTALGAGPLAGIAAGLQALDAPALFVCAVDMPLLRPALLRRLLQEIDGFDLAIPIRDAGYEPLCAIYSRSSLPVIRQRLEQHHLRLQDLPHILHTRIVAGREWQEDDPAGDSFLSINTLDDFNHLRERAHQLGHLLERQSQVGLPYAPPPQPFPSDQ